MAKKKDVHPQQHPAISQPDGAADRGVNPSAPTEGTENAFTSDKNPHPSPKGSSTADSFGQAGSPQGYGNHQFGDKTVRSEEDKDKKEDRKKEDAA